MKKKIVIALGGNALGDTNDEQILTVKGATQSIFKLIEEGYEVVVVHGNGPQVGKIQLAFSAGSSVDANIETMPLPESIAMSQGYIGYHLQNSLVNILRKSDKQDGVVTVLTQALVDKEDSSFTNPTKPIGPFYSLEEIQAKGYDHYVEDSGRGYRQIVASPLPLELIEASSIRSLMESGNVVICAGGGGIPVINQEGEYVPVDAVIDKDAAASLLAKQIDADMLIILTAVDQVALNYGTENVEWLDELNVRKLDEYISQNHFAPGSMLPKVLAAKRFVENNPNKRAIITSLESANDAINGKKGTHIID